MKQILSRAYFASLFFAFLLFSFPSISLAVVGETTLTGVPPNTVITLINEETGEKTEEKSDDKGVVIIPLFDKGWKSGKHTVTCTIGDHPFSSTIALGDGLNKIDLSTVIAKDIAKKTFRLSQPIKMPIPETSVSDTAASIGKSVVGGLLGGFLGGRGISSGGSRDEGPKLTAKPSYPEQTLTSKDGKTKATISGVVDNGKCQIVTGVSESPGNGAPHLILLQSRNGETLQPNDVTAYQIWEVWGGWKLTVSWTKSYYENGQLVRRESGGWNTGWITFVDRFKSPADIPAIWKDIGGKPFEGIRGVIANFNLPDKFIPADWNLIAHVTTKDGSSIVTQPFVTELATGNQGVLTFRQRETTYWEESL
jgi:hypothetical protein